MKPENNFTQETRCDHCKHYLPLGEPYHYEANGYQDGVTVFGFCGKNAGLFRFYPVYIPDGGVCKDFSAQKYSKKRNGPQASQLMLGGV